MLNIYFGLKAAQQSVTKCIAMIVINLVAPKAGAKLELLFNKPGSEEETRECNVVWDLYCKTFYRRTVLS